MKHLIRLFTLVLLAGLVPTPALAWGQYGHETVAQIALSEVRPATRRRIVALLRQSRALQIPQCRLRSIEDASVWPDCIRGLKDRFSYTAPWHYQNVDICKPFDLKSACKDGNCVSAQITRNAKLLADKTLPPRERLMALAFLIHFVGDLHMPLHAGDRSDRGGNDVKASYGIVAGARMNMHSMWDGPLAERAISTPPGGARGLMAGVSAAERAAMAAGTPEDWSRETWQVAHDAVYAVGRGRDACGAVPARARFDDAKIEAAIPVVRLQVERAGVRLARVLDEGLR
jgi:hypothetical protein